MSTEQIQKFQPDRTLYLRGFDGAGAAAALYNTSPTGFSVSGVFRDMADFCVLVIYDADNTFEHYTLRHLPDFNLTGLVLNFNLTYQGLQPIDSAKYSWIDWAQLDVIPIAGPSQKVVLWDHATLAAGNFTPAQATFTFTAPGGCTVYDRLTLFVNNTSFDFVAAGGESAGDVAQWFASYINNYNWAAFQNSSVAVVASTAPGGQLTLTYARAGYVNVSGVNVTWTLPNSPDPSNPLPPGIKFPGLSAGSTLYISGQPYAIASVTSPTTLTLTAPAPNQTSAPYLAEYGGVDGNGLTVYFTVRSPNVTLTLDSPARALTGGNSSNVTWNINLDFTALGIDQLRQAWLTFAPQLTACAAYADTEWTANFQNWTLTDPNAIAPLKIAGPAGTRIGNASATCTYSSAGWNVQSANNYWHGFARVTNSPGSSVTVTYSNSQIHDLYLGTSLYLDRGAISIGVDGDAATTLDCYLDVTSELVTRRLLRSGLPPGTHRVTITLTTAQNSASSGTNFIFDYLEAAVPTTQIPDPAVTYSNVSPALDYDTGATYKMSPQRLLWSFDRLGFNGQINEYLGVFWWNQRIRAGAAWNSVVITVAGTWENNDYAELNIGGFVIRKSVITWDTPSTIADHFVYYINSSTVATWAEITAPGQFTIHPRTPQWSETIQVTAASSTGNITTSGLATGGVYGYWQVDPAASNPLNFAVRQWHTDLFNAVKSSGRLITTSFSMELVNPPDDGTIQNAWQARFYDRTPVQTDTGFANLVSSQCGFIPNMTAFQQQVYLAMAGLQSSAGLTPWLQFGEFLWWFYPSSNFVVSAVSASAAVTVITVPSHSMATGDRVVVTGVNGCTSANGTWTITVVDDTSFSIPVAPNGAWVANTGSVRGGSMAYYDAVTAAEAQTALGRPLQKFTCQDDDPAVNNSVDSSFLAARLKSHVDSIRAAVLAQYPTTKFEILYPNDVNNAVCLSGPGVPYSQGGRLNAAVNLPPEWHSQATSGLDSFKVEALSWSATYLNMDLASQAIVFALTPPMSWLPANVAYLIPWFNGVCPWPREFLLASTRGLNLINFWAYDHLALMSWPIPLPISPGKTGFQG